jgi:hypothetical protein
MGTFSGEAFFELHVPYILFWFALLMTYISHYMYIFLFSLRGFFPRSPSHSVCLLYFTALEDGGYSQWSGFTDCSRTCGEDGIRLRRRVCSHPYPRLGGRNCSSLGKPIQVFRCNRNPCPGESSFKLLAEQ